MYRMGEPGPTLWTAAQRLLVKVCCTNVASAYVRLTIIVAVKRAVVNVPCMWRKHCIDDEHMMYGWVTACATQ
jgi:hypothetical protein